MSSSKNWSCYEWVAVELLSCKRANAACVSLALGPKETFSLDVGSLLRSIYSEVLGKEIDYNYQ